MLQALFHDQPTPPSLDANLPGDWWITKMGSIDDERPEDHGRKTAPNKFGAHLLGANLIVAVFVPGLP
jgi:hypothetical protein